MEIPAFYQRYMSLVENDQLTNSCIIEGDQALAFYKSIPEQLSDYRYAEGKWSIKEILAHVIDTERVFSYRILRFGRGDQTELPGFDENFYAERMNIENRKFYQLINEFANLRASTVDLLSSLSAEQKLNNGTASGVSFNVTQLIKVLIGHEIHHRNVIEERYLKNE